MNDFKFELNYAGVGQLLADPGVLDVCMQYAQQMVGNLGDGYVAEGYYDTGYPKGARVAAHSVRARQDNLDNNSMLKEMGKNHD